MFEKSLYDLIKGLRNHKGAEEEYIQDSLRECKAEIRSQDMDKKATALLKLIYLEMFGYDMSWASFHVLEVMSSAKYLQKRAGYLGAVQSFRPDTEVLMLATNLLKKDLISPSIPNMSLPLITLPNITTTSLAMSLLPDVLSRISHTHAVVRKKAIVCLYRLTLAYPDALKLAWPKISERLMDDGEDTSVTTAVLNVVCELGWRRPHDFLPLAPRFFELLVEGGNNWMAIKIIKLFATLTPLEPRLVRKLHRPLVNIIETTTAMSLLYECINGLIQGGILDSDAKIEEKDEIANLCVGKLRGMVVSDSDPNLKYVALLAFNRIVHTYPVLVSMHQDVIMHCLEDADISIRLQALELVTKMVTSETLQSIVNQLIGQLMNHGQKSSRDWNEVEDAGLEYSASDLRKESTNPEAFSLLPADYRIQVLHRILDICSQDNYSNLPDFEWYVNVLVQLVNLLPADAEGSLTHMTNDELENDHQNYITGRIGSEIRNVVVRVREVREEATRAAESLILVDNRRSLFSGVHAPCNNILGSLAWVVGEYSGYLLSPGRTLETLVDLSNISLPGRTLSLYIQAIPKVLITIIRDCHPRLDSKNRSEVALILARVIEFLEILGAHPDLDVQERAIEFVEIMRLAADTITPTDPSSRDTPFLLSSAIPGLFHGLELNPVSINAQRKVPLPDQLHLYRPFNNGIWGIFSQDFRHHGVDAKPLFHDFYSKEEASMVGKQFLDQGPDDMQPAPSYQNTGGDFLVDPAAFMRRKLDRREHSRDDPFYIGTEDSGSGMPRLSHLSLNASSDDELDIDSIPIIDLKLSDVRIRRGEHMPSPVPSESRTTLGFRSKRYHVIPDEMIGGEESIGETIPAVSTKTNRPLLQIDSSGLERNAGKKGVSSRVPNIDSRPEGDEEEAVALQHLAKVRLEMQRASERVHPADIPAEGTLVKKKRKVKRPGVSESLQSRGQKGNHVSSLDRMEKRQQMRGEALVEEQSLT
ncbi:Adaptor protein complex AP-3 delta subunit [Aspergillus heteromorphus CBS 117.55]|uniref:AP-3 complex subunit delta n=1 Tax=Aspergillus heteromorphus CBS 117.55 TaxID=1448321 RepID=A0A317UUQ4_9EURO|nr:Adaptor protein complex AP-3 delta subunit [Aspergillus heteromorphus CBS 117.55]PWY64242.1 Adaptor protein complex AP-3 delta subunit [Aspergillus heteromorphus CBS 117.55]